jgi:predicted Rossmann fold nucleotide-binding protein DprA/Smf involved in DNA uptake
LRTRLATKRLPRVAALGNREHLSLPLLGFFCSAKCPGNLILDTYDLARALRDAGVPVIGGFHSPMERECLDLLLRGKQPVLVCPARSIHRMRIPQLWKAPLDDGRLLVLSRFSEKQRNATAELAARRNQFVAALADQVFIVHAATGSKTETFCRELLAQDKSVLTIDRPENRSLLDLGVEALAIEDVRKRWPPSVEPKQTCRKEKT